MVTKENNFAFTRSSRIKKFTKHHTCFKLAVQYQCTTYIYIYICLNTALKNMARPAPQW